MKLKLTVILFIMLQWAIMAQAAEFKQIYTNDGQRYWTYVDAHGYRLFEGLPKANGQRSCLIFSTKGQLIRYLKAVSK